MAKEHHYSLAVTWTGNTGTGTTNYTGYKREHTIQANNKPIILSSADPAFRGDPSCYNPEELFVASISSCHMLWYLHLCTVAGIIVVAYSDNATGIMEETSTGSGKFKEVTLNPIVTVKQESMIPKALELHKKANELCFIANSCNFPIKHNAKCTLD
jgi:organic hydroperoxide reductase OsmC/OhrA